MQEGTRVELNRCARRHVETHLSGFSRAHQLPARERPLWCTEYANRGL